MQGLYFLLLVFSIVCLGLIDKRYSLVFFKDKKLAFKVISVCVLLFILWDTAGILLNIFYIGRSNLLLGINVGNFPLEELFFLVLLNYTALITSQFLKLKRNLK